MSLALSSTNTRAEVVAAYIDNATYAEDGDVAKARRFAHACRILLVTDAKRMRTGDEEIEVDQRLIQGELDAVRTWLAAHGGTAAACAARE